MLKRRNTRRKPAGLQNAETVEPRIVLSAIQPIAVADADSDDVGKKAAKDAVQEAEKAQAETNNYALSAVKKAVGESVGKKAIAPTQIDPKLDMKVADHLHQNDFAAQEMINGKELVGNLKGGLDPEMELSPGDLSGRNNVGQDNNDGSEPSEAELDMWDALYGDDEDASLEAEWDLKGSGALDADASVEDMRAAQRSLEYAEAAEAARQAAEAAKRLQDAVKMPTPDDAGDGSDGNGEPTPDHDDLTPGVGDPSGDDEDSDGPVAETGNLDVGNTNWGEGNDGPDAKNEALAPVVQHVIDVYFESLGGKINPLPVK